MSTKQKKIISKCFFKGLKNPKGSDRDYEVISQIRIFKTLMWSYRSSESIKNKRNVSEMSNKLKHSQSEQT